MIAFLLRVLQQMPLPPTENVDTVLAWAVAALASAVAALFYALNKSKETHIADLISQRDAATTTANQRADQLYQLAADLHQTLANLESLVRATLGQGPA